MAVGVTDPIAFLSNAGDAWDIAVITTERAAEIQSAAKAEEWNAVIKKLSADIGSAVGHAIAKAFGG